MIPRVVFITGASSGIGRTCAEYLHSRGYLVYGASRSCPRIELAFETIQMNVDKDESVTAGIQYVLEKQKRIDAVINCAGFGFAGSVEDTPIAEAKAQFETNFFGTLRVCQAVLPVMRQQESGLIVNISSIAGLVSIPFQAFYSASKFAVEGMTEALRMEMLPFGVRVVLIEPGDFKTQFSANRKRTTGSGENTVYRDQLDRSLAVMEKEEQAGNSPIAIARLVERIMSDPSPTLRYPVGPLGETLAIVLKGILPFKVFERILMQHYQLQ
jgi:NAD(P)-dependent dehydrogenase (short-subunit alcohol dehydrogenase family)